MFVFERSSFVAALIVATENMNGSPKSHSEGFSLPWKSFEITQQIAANRALERELNDIAFVQREQAATSDGSENADLRRALVGRIRASKEAPLQIRYLKAQAASRRADLEFLEKELAGLRTSLTSVQEPGDDSSVEGEIDCLTRDISDANSHVRQLSAQIEEEDGEDCDLQAIKARLASVKAKTRAEADRKRALDDEIRVLLGDLGYESIEHLSCSLESELDQRRSRFNLVKDLIAREEEANSRLKEQLQAIKTDLEKVKKEKADVTERQVRSYRLFASSSLRELAQPG